MKAARYFSPKDVRVVDVPTPEPGVGEVLVRIAYNGICGSDLGAYLDGTGTAQSAPHPLSAHKNPTTLGHEFSGTVSAIGEGVETLAVGQRVAVEPIFSCGECAQCRTGHFPHCERGLGPSFSVNSLGLGADGGLGEYVVVHTRYAHPLPDGLDLDLAALAEPTAVVFEALKRAEFSAGDNIAISGAGPIGLLLATVASLSGAGRIFISDIVDERLAKARALGFADVIDAAKGEPAAIITGAVPGGVDIAFDCAGVQSSIDTSIGAVRNNGNVMAVAIFHAPVTIPLILLTLKGLTLRTTLGYNNIFPRVIAMIHAHQDRFRPLITHVTDLDDVVPDGFERLLDGRSEMKVLVRVGGDD
jgi:(R,R)-butanediol dehydrogenase / meso-butanediol dehydrogenase / diacetyl reductase